MKPITILLDEGHYEGCPGKRSPAKEDGRLLFEWKFARELGKRIKLTCDQLGIKCIRTTAKYNEQSLTLRANTINTLVRQESEHDRLCLMISLHGNAASNAGWSNASGWEVWTTEGTNNSDKFAKLLCEHFKKIFPDLKLRGHKEKNFTLIYKCNCPCVLTENFFYDNKNDFELMMSESGLQKLTDLHMAAICDYIEYNKVP